MQIKKKENLKQIERKIRGYIFQRDLAESEEEVPFRYNPKESIESRRLVQSLLDPPIKIKELKTLTRNEYLKYLF